MAITTINYLSLTGLQSYDSRIKEFIAAKVNEGDALSFKYVNLENGVLKFYTVNPITEDTVADFEIELPEQDLSNLMALVKDATSGNIATFGENGQVVDSGVALADLATKDEVKAVSDYIGVIPEDSESSNVIAYINEKAQEVLESATGGSSESAASVKLALDSYKAENDPKVAANTDAIAAIQKDYLKSSDKEELEDKIAENASAIELLTNGVDSETVDGVNDLIKYVNEHGTEVTQMQSDIADNKSAIEDEVSAREALDARVVVVEGKAHEHENKDVLDGITAEKVTAWDSSEANAKAYVDEKIAGVDLSGIATNAADIDKIEESLAVGGATATAIANAQAKADAAQSDIDAFEESYATDKAALEAKDTEIEGNVSTLQADVAALKEVEHVEVTEDQINQLFA